MSFAQSFLCFSAMIASAVLLDLAILFSVFWRKRKEYLFALHLHALLDNPSDQSEGMVTDAEQAADSPISKHALQWERTGGLFSIIPLFRRSQPKAGVLQRASSAKRRFVFFRNARLRRTAVWTLCIGANLLLLGGGIYGVYSLFKPLPEIAITYPENGEILSGYDRPIALGFNVPVDLQKLELHMEPETEGEWEYDYFLGQERYAFGATFHPSISFPPGEKVMVYVAYMANPFHPGAGQEYLLEFTPTPLPSITDTQPQQREEDILVDTAVVLSLDHPNGPHAQWEITVSPETEFSLVEKSDSLVINFASDLNQGTIYTLAAERIPVMYDLRDQQVRNAGEAESVLTLTFETVRPPFIASFSPEGTGILADTPVIIAFDTAMQPESVEQLATLTPETAGVFSWNDEKTVMTFTPEAWQKETTYTITLAKGTTNAKGGKFEADISYSFATIGAVRVVSTSPASGASGIGVGTSIGISFDQDVDHASAEQAFSLTPSVPGGFNWQGNTMYFDPAGNLGYNTAYTFRLTSGIKSVHGLNARESFQGSFTTQDARVMLDVPLYYQGRSGDSAFYCNLVSARMLLAYRGVYISDAQMRADAGYGGVRGSGNPHNGFVTNYGTYWGPVSAGAGKYRSVRLMSGGNLTELLQEVQNGNPVMIWGQNGWSTPTNISWTADDGTSIYAVSGMHSVVVKGFQGTPENPTAIYINDPWRGSTTLTVAKFKSNWSYFNMAMVVY
ncbi:MAG TPA: Ig-like domain-containing protein [bacterium]|nr:Ig-like domain-containing protein [bacterium]